MKILITGAAGFLGSHLTDLLLREGHRVIGLDNLSTGSAKNLSHLQNDENFQFHFGDVTQEYDFDVDAIFNFASPASPIQYQINPVQTLMTNVVGTLNGLKLAKRRGCIFIQASTSEVYGDPDVSPQPEAYLGKVNPTGPRACYDEGKRAAETLVFDYIRHYKVDARVVRIFNTYGPRMSRDDGRVVSNFIVSALEGNPVTLYGDGKQTRSFCYYSDTLDGVLKLFSLKSPFPGPINIGNPFELTMKELSELVLSHTSSSSEIVHLPLPEDDPKQRCPDIELAMKVLQWSPRTTIEDGLRITIDYFKNN